MTKKPNKPSDDDVPVAIDEKARAALRSLAVLVRAMTPGVSEEMAARRDFLYEVEALGCER